MQTSLGNLLKGSLTMSVVQMPIFYVRCISSKRGKWISDFPSRKFTVCISALRVLSSEHKPSAKIKEGFFCNSHKQSVSRYQGQYYTNFL